MDEQILRNIHENKDNRPDSISIAESTKAPGVKVYVNFATMTEPEVRALINTAMSARAYMQGGMGQ